MAADSSRTGVRTPGRFFLVEFVANVLDVAQFTARRRLVLIRRKVVKNQLVTERGVTVARGYMNDCCPQSVA